MTDVPSAPKVAAASDIFGQAAKANDKKCPKEKRTMLRNLDTVSAKVLDPYDVSIMNDIDLKRLWQIIEKGNDYASFYSELAATDDKCKDSKFRKGIGISRLAQTLVNFGEYFLRATDLRKMLKDVIVAKIDAEIRELLPHVKNLNAGTKDNCNEATFGGLKKKRKLQATESPATSPSTSDLRVSSIALYEFLKASEASNLQKFMKEIASGGIHYATFCGVMTARAWLEHAYISEDHLVQCVLERHSSSASASSEAPIRAVFCGDLFDGA